MRSLVVAATAAASVLVSLAVTPTTAHADPYIGVGVGTSSAGNDRIASPEATSRSGRLLFGFAFGLSRGRLAIEGEANRFDLQLNGEALASSMLGVGLKYSFPIGNGFELFGRGGVQRTWLSAGDNDPVGAYAGAGNGWYLGAGIEYRLPILPIGSIFVDYEHQSATIDAPQSTQFGETAGMFTLGATISL